MINWKFWRSPVLWDRACVFLNERGHDGEPKCPIADRYRCTKQYAKNACPLLPVNMKMEQEEFESKYPPFHWDRAPDGTPRTYHGQILF